ncbi:hypothetical protein HY440_01980 [Candidatus Microgenomates bacterium]|nr:hypothetical protein [Candidatus Microgenomates bacterium]
MRILTAIFRILQSAAFYLLTGAVIFGEFGFLVALVPKQVAEISSLQQKSRETSSEVDSLNTAIKVLRSVDRKKLASQLATVNAALPTVKKTSGVLSGISGIAFGSGVNLQQIEFAPGRISTGSAQVTTDRILSGTNVRVLEASADVRGDLVKLKNFVTQIQNSSQLVGIKSINYSGSSSRTQSAGLSLEVFYEPAESSGLDWNKVRAISAEEEKIVAKLPASDVFTVPAELR